MTTLILACILVGVAFLVSPLVEAALNRSKLSRRVRGERNVFVLIDCEDCAAEGWPARSTLSDDPRTQSCARCGGTHLVLVGHRPDAGAVETALAEIEAHEARHIAARNALRLACGLEPEA